MATTISGSYSQSDGFYVTLSTGCVVRLAPVSGNSSTTPIPTGMRKRTRKLQAVTMTKGVSPTTGGLTNPSDYEIELCLNAFGYTTFPTVPYWADDNGNTDTFSLMESVTISQSTDMGEGGIWDITIEFSPWMLDNNNVNPLLQTPNVIWSFEQNEYAVLFDVNNNYLANSAGDPYLPARTIKYGNPILQFRRNEATYSPSVAQQYIWHTNSDVFLGAPANTCLIRDIRAELVKSIYGYYYVMEYEFAFNFRTDNNGNVIGWADYMLDEGLNQLVTTGGSTSKVPILVGGAATTETQPLDGSGHALPQGGTLVFTTRQTIPQVAFAPLNITLPA